MQESSQGRGTREAKHVETRWTARAGGSRRSSKKRIKGSGSGAGRVMGVGFSEGGGDTGGRSRCGEGGLRSGAV